MIKLLRFLTFLVVLGVIALLAFIFVPTQTTPPVTQLPDNWQPEEGAGQYAAFAADCTACHTAEGGQRFAGGRAIVTPMGTIWSSNITPDKETGIGNYTLDQFRAALYDGIRSDGAHLYPAMPYENYRYLSEEDVRGIYDYFMHGVKPVKNEVQETKLAFPFNLRFGIRAWNWLTLTSDAGFTPAGKSKTEDRGQYLVEGPGHCGACHTPRNRLMMQAGIKSGDEHFLTGGIINGWYAPPLRGPKSAIQKWDIEQTADFLATGRNAHATANGEMGLVVRDSLQHLSNDDVKAITVFLKGIDGETFELSEQKSSPEETQSLPAEPADEAGAATAKMLTEASPDMPLGARLYLDNCSACHFVTGKGAPGIFPELAGNGLANGTESEPLISIILNGATVESTKQRPMRLVMQGYADRLSDDEVAELASFVRSGWGNSGTAVTPAQVAEQRSKIPGQINRTTVTTE